MKEERRLVISPKCRPRQGWEEAFRAADPVAHDEFLLGSAENEFDREEWQWSVAPRGAKEKHSSTLPPAVTRGRAGTECPSRGGAR